MILAEEFGPLTAIPGIAWSDYGGKPQGWGRTYRGRSGRQVWFHAAIPTPTIQVNEQALSSPELRTVFILFNAESGCFIKHLSLWDGPNPTEPGRGLRIEGDHSRLDSFNQFTPRQTTFIQFGLGISILVEFTRETNITFNSAGAAFRIT